MAEGKRKISVKAVAAGLLVFLSGVLLVAVVGVLLGALAAYKASQSGASQKQIIAEISRALATPGFSLVCFGVVAAFTVLGGYVAAQRVKAAAAAHALPIGLLSLFASILFIPLAPAPTPAWFLPVALLLPVPLALAGGYLGGFAWSPFALVEDEENATESAIPDQKALELWLAKMLKRQEQVVGPLVQQRREQELEQRQQAITEEKRFALDRAMEQARAEACDGMRDIVRQAFMSHPAATEEDFERCWPSIRDEMFKQHALQVYNAQRAHAPGDL